jgi:UDP-N-acetylglucosamine:LPS N-acetylglucosamine transferase
MKACFIASSGGHWEELMCLKAIADEHDTVYITEDGGQARDSSLKNMYRLPQINRRQKDFLWRFLKLIFAAGKIMLREKPDFIITTGALISFPFCVYAKLMKAKVIYIETFARVYNRSLTGRLVYPIADLFLVQWESLLELYPKAKYVGGIF